MTHSRTLSHWLKHAGTPVARPITLLVLVAALWLTSGVHLGLMLTDPSLYDAAAQDMSTTQQALLRSALVSQSVFLTGVLWVGCLGLFKGWRVARTVWWVALVFVFLADLLRLALSSVSLLVELLFASDWSEIPADKWFPAVYNWAVFAALVLLSLLLLLPAVNQWFKALQQHRQNGQAHPTTHAPSALPAHLTDWVQWARPGSVNAALALGLLGLVLGMVNMVMFAPEWMDLLESPELVADSSSEHHWMLWGLGLGVLLTLVCGYFVAKRSQIARWLWALFSVYGLINTLPLITTYYETSWLEGSLLFVSTAFNIASVVLLFTPKARAWFAQPPAPHATEGS